LIHPFGGCSSPTPAAATRVATFVDFETCDAAGWVHNVAAGLGFAVRVANCAHESWKWRRVNRKTDRNNALKLARMVLLEFGPAGIRHFRLHDARDHADPATRTPFPSTSGCSATPVSLAASFTRDRRPWIASL